MWFALVLAMKCRWQGVVLAASGLCRAAQVRAGRGSQLWTGRW